MNKFSREFVRIARLIIGYDDEVASLLRKFHAMPPGREKTVLKKYIDKLIEKQGKSGIERSRSSGYEIVKNEYSPNDVYRSYRGDGYTFVGTGGRLWYDSLDKSHEEMFKDLSILREYIEEMPKEEASEMADLLDKYTFVELEDIEEGLDKMYEVDPNVIKLIPDVLAHGEVCEIRGRFLTQDEEGEDNYGAGDVFLWDTDSTSNKSVLDNVVKQVEKDSQIQVRRVYLG